MKTIPHFSPWHGVFGKGRWEVKGVKRPDFGGWWMKELLEMPNGKLREMGRVEEEEEGGSALSHTENEKGPDFFSPFSLAASFFCPHLLNHE